MKCKIKKIDGDKIFIYDYDDNKELEFTNDELRKNMVIFKNKFIIKLVLNWLFYKCC